VFCARGPQGEAVAVELYKQIAANKRRSVGLFLVVLLLFAGTGYAFGVLVVPGYALPSLVIALLLAFVMGWTAYWRSDQIALAMSGARETTPDEYPQVHNLVEALSIAAGLPKPRVFLIEDPAPNAFATGRDPSHGTVAVTTGLLERLNRDELEGVLAHEICHIRNYDILVGSVVAVLVGSVVLLSDWAVRSMWLRGAGVGGRRGRGSGRNNGGGSILPLIAFFFLLLAPIAAQLMRFAVSRQREQLADASAVDLTRYPAGLRSALEILAADSTVVRNRSRATAHMWIESPLDMAKGQKGTGLNRLFMTHPPIEKRIEVLWKIEGRPLP